MLKQRIITAVLLGSILVLSILFAPAQWLCALLILTLLLAGWEWARMSGCAHPVAQYSYALLIILLCGVLDHFISPLWLLCLSGFWWLCACVLVIRYPHYPTLYRSKHIKLLQGIFVLVPLYVGLSWLYQQPQGRSNLLFLLFLIWVADSGAYAFGKLWGRHKIKPVLSPGKSWEGAIGSFLSVSLFTGLANATMTLPIQDSRLFLIAGLVVFFSMIGDFFESILKRDAQLKDSSQLLPGHGGVVDRIDSLTAAAPLFVLLLMIM